MEIAEASPTQIFASQETRPVTKEQIKALQKCLEDKIALFGEKGTKNKKGAAILQFCVITFSVATPILIGWKSDSPTSLLLANLALASSALSAGTNTLYNYFDYKDLWVQYKVARNELESIVAELQYLESSGLENVTQSQIAVLFKNYVQVCADTNSFYCETRLARDDVSNPPKQA